MLDMLVLGAWETRHIGYYVFGEPLVALAPLSKIIEGLNKLFSYACEVVWEYGCGVDGKDFGVEVGEYVGGASWNFTYISGEIAQEFIIFLVSSLEEGTP